MQLLHYIDAVITPCSNDSISVVRQTVSAASVQEENVVELCRTESLDLLCRGKKMEKNRLESCRNVYRDTD